MADQSGRKIAFGIGKESVRGTAVAASYWIQHLAADFYNKSNKKYNESVLGVLNKYNASEIVQDWAEGKIEGKVTDKTFGLLLLAALGTDTPAAHSGETIVYDHVITQSQSNVPQSLTVVRKDSNSDYRFALAMLQNLEMKVAVGEFVTFVAQFMSKKGATASDTVAYVAENEFKAKYATVKLATNEAGLGAASAFPVKDCKITIERTLNPYYVVGQNSPADIFVEEFHVKGDMTLRYTDQTYENLHFNNTPQALLLDIVNTDVTLGNAANPELKIQLPKVVLDAWTVNQNRPNIVEQTFGFEGLYDISTTKELTVTLTNLVSAY